MNGIRINSNALLAYLCRKSESLEFIEGKHLKEHLIPLLHSTSFMPRITLTNADNIKEELNNSEMENARKSTYATVSKIKEESVNSSSELDTVEEKKNEVIKKVKIGKLNFKKLNTTFTLKKKDTMQEMGLLSPVSANVYYETEEDINEQIQSIIFRISDALFVKQLSVCDILNKGTEDHPGSLIIDRTIDGKEYQLIRRNHLFDCFGTVGVPLKLSEKRYLKSLFMPLILDLINVDNVIDTFEALGIHEMTPKGTQNIDYRILTGVGIRTVNKIIKFMSNHSLKSLKEFLKDCVMKSITVVSKNKERTIETVSLSDLQTLLRQRKIIDYGEDLDEKLVEILQLSPEHDEWLVIK